LGLEREILKMKPYPLPANLNAEPEQKLAITSGKWRCRFFYVRIRIDTTNQAYRLSSKLNAYHLKTKKQIKAAVDGICKAVKGFIEVKAITTRKQTKVKVSSGRTCLNLAGIFKNYFQDARIVRLNKLHEHN